MLVLRAVSSAKARLPHEREARVMRVFRVVFRSLGRLFRPFRHYSFPYSGFRISPKPGAEELSKDLDLDLSEAGEPHVALPDAEISEKERQEAVRRYQRELREKSRR